MATQPISAVSKITIRVLAFARLRELLGFGSRDVELAEGATLDALWKQLASGNGEIEGLRATTRFARNGELVAGETVLRTGDEVALMPPVGGG
ncbi:MAG: MoaD/ThiS family protein [Candidatus Eremiobacteraeota bacterium]|nr:MoaD/ThiS family protein [Candidatus Eremiobacteraeota bacterium]